MELILAFLLGVALTSVVAYFLIRQTQSSARAEYSAYREHVEQSNAEREKREAEAKAEREQKEQEAKAEREALAQKQLELLKAQFETSSQRLLKERQEELGKANTESLGRLIDPIQKEMENVRKLMADTRSAHDKNTSELEGALKAMIEQTTQISQNANNLADALKNRGKVHGDWGEQVLEDILSGSGLRAGEEYMTQQSFKGEKGNELRPDVVIYCADEKRIIVDSKVSLTAYSDALGADNEDERQEAVKRNYESVKKHVKELADKQYPKYVEGAMNYVLMFVPNEGAYVMAMNYDHALAQEAFRKGVIIVNPTNLMLALHLVLQTWHQTRQEDNCRKILDTANGLYEKVVGLVDTCTTLGDQLGTAQKTYMKAMNQLTEGTGNVLRRVEGFRDLGISSTKRPKNLNRQELKEELSE